MTRYDVRPAEPADAEVLGAVHVRIWQQAYVGLMPAEHLDGLSVPGSVERWRESLALTRPTRPARTAPERATYVGTADGAVVGFCTAGPTRDDPPDPAHELWVLNVLAEHHGSGLATLLLDTTFAAAGIDDTTPVSLWVLRGNERAMAFYRGRGFAATGATKAHPATGVLEERWIRS